MSGTDGEGGASTAPQETTGEQAETSSEENAAPTSTSAAPTNSNDAPPSSSEAKCPTVEKVEESDEDDPEEDDDGAVENLLSYMKEKLNIGGKEKKIPPVLSSADLDGVVDYILSGRCKNIITMAGAGISTSAGIPDFRSEGSGLYHNLQKYNLPHPQAIFELSFFRKNPQPFFTLAKELYPGSFNPTPSHYFIKLLEKKGLLTRHYTQNIDTLEHVAGISEDKLIEAHGSFRTAHCLDCRKLYSQDWVKEEVFADRVPTCEECSGVVKPDIVFFGEGLPNRFFKGLATDFPICDLLIILGTSLTVQPFASLIDNVSSTCPRLLLNREAVGEDTSVLSSLQQMMGRGGGLRLQCPANSRDVALLADCDQGCKTLAHKLGWQEELDQLIKEGNQQKKD